MAKVKIVRDEEGFTYLHTHKGHTAAEIVEAVAPYVGRLVLASLSAEGGYSQRHWVELKKVEGEIVTLKVPDLDHSVVISVGAAFGTAVTMVDKALKCEACTWTEANGMFDEATGQLSHPACTGTAQKPCPGMEDA